MKSSRATTSVAPPSFGPSAAFPVLMRTRPIESVNVTPRNESPLLNVGTKNVPSDTFARLKNSRLEVFARSTSVNTAPNPKMDAGVLVPGTKKSASITLLPSGLKSRGALKV